MDETIEEDVQKVETKKHYKSKHTICTRILAAILAFLMVASLAVTVVSFFVNR